MSSRPVMEKTQEDDKREIMDFLGDISDFHVIDVRKSDTNSATSIKDSTNVTQPILKNADYVMTNITDENNPFRQFAMDNELTDVLSVEKPRTTATTNVSNITTVNYQDSDKVQIEQSNITPDLFSDVSTKTMTSQSQNTAITISDWEDIDDGNSASIFWTDKSPTSYPAYSSYTSYAGQRSKTKDEDRLKRVTSDMQTKQSEPSSTRGIRGTKGETGNDDSIPTRGHSKGKGKVTFGTVQRKYYTDQDTPTMDALLNEEIFNYRKYIKLQEEQASTTRKLVKLERQLEETIQKKNNLQVELLEADRKLSKLETREALFNEKETKFNHVLSKLQAEVNKAKEEALGHERKSARLERLIDDLNDKRRKDQEEIENSKKRVNDLEIRLRDIEKDFESNQSASLRNMKELSGSTAKLEHEREENSELRITIECLQDKLRNAEDNANKAMREKATLLGEINEIRSDIERWKRDAKSGKMKQVEVLSLADRYRTQYQEQKDVIENVIKARRQLENEVHENMVLAEKREAQSKQYLKKINELEEIVGQLKKENESLRNRLMEDYQMKRRRDDDRYGNERSKGYYRGKEISDQRQNQLLLVTNELHDKIVMLEEENRCLKSNLASEKVKLESYEGKIQLSEREKRMQDKEHRMEKQQLEREIKDLKSHINQLLERKGTDGNQRVSRSRTPSLDDRVESSKQSTLHSPLLRKDYYRSDPDLLTRSTDIRPLGSQSPRSYTPLAERVSSMPDLNIGRDYEQSSSTYLGYQRKYSPKNQYRASDYTASETYKDDSLEWMTSSYLKSKYGILPKHEHYLTDGKCKHESTSNQYYSYRDHSSYLNRHNSLSPRYNYLKSEKSESANYGKGSSLLKETTGSQNDANLKQEIMVSTASSANAQESSSSSTKAGILVNTSDTNDQIHRRKGSNSPRDQKNIFDSNFLSQSKESLLDDNKDLPPNKE